MEIEDDEAYEVEDIVEHRIEKNGTKSYKIKWVGFDQSENCWVPESNMNSPDILKSYWNRQKSLRKPEGKSRKKLISRIEERVRRKQSLSSSSSRHREPSPYSKNVNSSELSVTPKTTKKIGLIPPPLPEKKWTDNTVEKEKSKTIINTLLTLNRDPTNVTIRKNHSGSTTPVSRSRPQSGMNDFTYTDRATSSSPLELNEVIQKDTVVDYYNDVPEEWEEQSGLERGLQIQEILSVGQQDGKCYGCVRYRNHDVLEWVAFSFIEEKDPNALIQYFEKLQFDKVSDEVIKCNNGRK